MIPNDLLLCLAFIIRDSSTEQLHPSLFTTPPTYYLPPRKMRRVQEQSHQHPRQRPRNRNRHDPRKEQQSHSLPIDSLERAIAKTDADGGASDTHGCRDGKSVLREEEDGDGGAEFHRGTAGG